MFKNDDHYEVMMRSSLHLMYGPTQKNCSFFFFFFSLKTSEPASEMDAASAQRPAGEGCYQSQFRPYQMVIVCEMPQCIHNQNKPDTAQQAPRGKHTLSLITAVSAGCSREALCLFCSGLSCRGRGACGIAAPH